MSVEDKLKAWEDLKVLSFTRIAASALSLSVLSLLVRVMLNILGRQLYLEHSLDGLPEKQG